MSGAGSRAARTDEPLHTVEAALAAVLAAIDGPTEPEPAWIRDALGRVTAEDALAATDLPPWDNAAMDGYAVRAADIVGATEDRPALLEVVGDVAAGADTGVAVGRGLAVRIATGARLPAGADAAVQVELTTPADAAGLAAGRLQAQHDAEGDDVVVTQCGCGGIVERQQVEDRLPAGLRG